MRYVPVLAILCFRFPVTAQTVEADRQTLQTLLTEVQQLRLAIQGVWS
jgi:hypothetical protein